MEIFLLWLFLISGLVLTGILLTKRPLIQWLLCFFIAAYFASFLGDLVAKAGMLTYPVKLFPQLQSSVLYEYLLLPLICVRHVQITYQSSFLKWCLYAFFYSGVVTIVEVLLEKYTALVHFINWNWLYSLISVMFFIVGIRLLMWLINTARKNSNSPG
ncbi:hypothetical protein SAMN05216238_101402 [Lentibacillus persicus]|uniref:Rod shape-determining protein MreD n=1 Tax=Lentibacillus persicus TaxID=640948 RepID=A0A1I1SFE6_9BACI|nr:CBO0543 family protein [Lentibacillus persicus]SFD45205.1 hypothetical protein SAMN05216238_101402 [Lentibacillus persicus]